MNEAQANELKSLLEARSIALVQRNADFFKQLLANDFTYINASGAILDKATYLQFYIESGLIQWQSQKLDDVHIRFYADVAVVTCTIHDRAIFDNTEKDGYFRSTQVFARQADGWRY